MQVNNGQSVSAPTPSPTRAGYNFEGWYSDSGLTSKVTFPYAIIGNITLYANWTPIEVVTYTVSFVSNGGNSVPSVQINSGGSISAPNPPPTLTDYDFEGWYSNPELASKVTFPYTVIDNTTLYANWTRIVFGVTYTVSFVSNNGSSVPPVQVDRGESINVPTPPTRVGYDFEGWYSDLGLTDRFNFASPITQNTTLYANWMRMEGVMDIASVNKFEAGPYMENDKIKYSYSYRGYDFYYIYLGELRNIPMYYETPFHFGTIAETVYEFSTETTNSTAIHNTISLSSQTAISQATENTESKTTGQKLGIELSNKFGLNLFDLSFLNPALKLNGEFSWSQHTSKTNSTGFQETTSLEETIGYVSTSTINHRVTVTYPFSKSRGDREGYYRHTYFVASDVYLYVIKDHTGVIYYEIKEHVKSSPFWRLDYSETSDFKKSDSTTFEFDIALLDNLPPAGTVTVVFDKNNSDLGGTEANPQTRMLNVGASVGISLWPEPPMRAEHTFKGWNTVAGGSGTVFLATTNIPSSITVYAQWEPVPTYELTAKPNPAQGGTVAPLSTSGILGGSSVNVTATPASHYTFDKWVLEGGSAVIVSPNNQTTAVTVNSNAQVRADFKQNMYTLTVTRNIIAGGTVSPTSQSNISAGTSIQVIANPNDGYEFVNWSYVNGTSNIFDPNRQSTTVSLQSNATIMANFQLRTFTLSTSRYPTNWGSVTPVSGTYSANTPISITASPNTGYKFTDWIVTGGTATFGNAGIASTTVTLRSNTTIRANFLLTDAKYEGEVGELSLRVPVGSSFATRFFIRYLNISGVWIDVRVPNNIEVGQTRTADPGDYGIPDESMVRVYSDIVWGNTKLSEEHFRYKKGSSRIASYNHTGTTFINTLRYNGVN